MTYNPSLYRVRTELKDAIAAAGLTQGEAARLIRMAPGTLTGKLNGTGPMDSAEESAIMAAINEKKLEAA